MRVRIEEENEFKVQRKNELSVTNTVHNDPVEYGTVQFSKCDFIVKDVHLLCHIINDNISRVKS